MSADFETVLDECLARVDGGESPDACLSDYPALASELQPLLAMAVGLRSAPAPRARPEAVTAGKQKVLAAFAAQQPRQAAPPGFGQRLAAGLTRVFRIGPLANSGYALRFALGMLIALVLGTTSAVAASSRSLPGDALYPLKQSVESLRLALTLDSQSRQALETQFEGQRLLEIQSLMQLRRQATVEFEDVLQAIGDNGWWVVGPFAIQVTDSTVVVGQPAPGERVRVQVRIQGDGTLAALRVTAETEHGHGPEHRSGADGLQFASPLPAGTPVHEPGHESLPGPADTHREEPADRSDHEMVPTSDAQDHLLPTSEPGHHEIPTVMPNEPPTALPTHHLEPTAAPTAMPAHHAEPTTEPSHPPAPTAQPQHQPQPTSEPSHHDPAPMPEEPRHGDSEQRSGGDESGRRH